MIIILSLFVPFHNAFHNTFHMALLFASIGQTLKLLNQLIESKQIESIDKFIDVEKRFKAFTSGDQEYDRSKKEIDELKKQRDELIDALINMLK